MADQCGPMVGKSGTRASRMVFHTGGARDPFPGTGSAVPLAGWHGERGVGYTPHQQERLEFAGSLVSCARSAGHNWEDRG